MLYKREIYDQVIIQYIILFTLAKANRIVTHNQLTSLILDNCNIRFTEFRIALDNLEKIGYVRVFCPDKKETYCELLPPGVEANGFFYRQIPIYIREPIEDYIAPFFKEEAIKKSVVAELLPLNSKEFMADLGLYDNSTPIMKLSVYTGTRELANSMIRTFKKDPQKIYETVLNVLSEDIDNNDTENIDDTSQKNDENL